MYFFYLNLTLGQSCTSWGAVVSILSTEFVVIHLKRNYVLTETLPIPAAIVSSSSLGRDSDSLEAPTAALS